MENKQQVTVADNKQFPQLVPHTKEKLLLYLDIIGVAQEMTQHEKDYFIETAQAYCLNPFRREIRCVQRWIGGKRIFAVITGYDVYIKRAERTGKEQKAICSIGDKKVNVNGELVDFAEIVKVAREYIHCIGGFEKLAEWGLR